MSRRGPRRPQPLALLLTLFLAAGVGPSAGSGLGATLVAGVPPPGGGGPAAGAPPGNATAAAATAAPRPAVKDVGFGLGPSGFGRGGGFDSVLAAVFNKVAKGTTATPLTTRPPPMAPTTTPAPTTTRAPTTTVRPPTLPPLPTELVPLPPPPPPPPAGAGGATPTRRAPHPDYAPPNRPPPHPAEYNPFANKAILRGSQSEIGSAGPGRKPHPQLVPPRPPMDELIPLRPVNTPSQGQGGGKGADTVAPIPEAPRPERPPDRAPERPGSAGKHHLDAHIHTVASGPAPAPALAPVGHHQGGLGQGHGHGHGHGHSAGHNGNHSLKGAKPTELLEQVKQDSIIGVHQGEVADPAIHRDEEDNMKEVLMVPATSPPSSGSRPMAGGGPVAGMGAGGEWHLAWTAQVYGLGTMWGVLAALSLVAAVFVDSRTRLVPRVHFTMLLALLLALAAANSVSLFYDVINHDQLQQQQHRPTTREQQQQQGAAGAPASEASSAGAEGADAAAVAATRVPQLLADLTLPFLPAAFSVFFFVVLRVNHIPCGNSGVPQTPAFLVLLFLFLATTMSLEVASCAVAAAPDGDGAGGSGLRAGARGLTVTVAALLGLAYLVVYRPLRRAAAKKQAEQLRAAYTAFRRLPTPALPRVVNALLVCALLLVALATVAAYRLMDTTLMGGNTDWRLPPWWYLRLAEHVGSLLVGFLLLWCATRGPARGADERSTASRSSRGTPGALSLVSCTGRRFLFDCPSTGSEENKTSEDNTYPAVCASNHAILNYTQHTGNKLYDDSFPLANLHSAPPLNSSGDDFCSVPTMPKRASRASAGSGGKAGTLLPYAKASRRAAPGPGHHTLGPGGQLYDAEAGRDTLRRGARTTGRTRKARHARHQQEVYSNCPQDDDYDQRNDLDGLADDFTVFKQYASTGSSESADNYDVPMLVGAPVADVVAPGNKRHRRERRERGGGASDRSDRDDPRPLHHQHRKAARHAVSAPPADSLSPASPSDLSDCDRLSSNRSSYDEGAPMNVRTQPQQHASHHGHLSNHHHHHRAKAGKQVLLYDASEDDVTPDSAVVADITASPRQGHHSPREKRPGAKRLGRHGRHQQHLESPSSPELHDNVWSPQ